VVKTIGGRIKRKKLSSRQPAFVNEYMRCWNASEAARRTGSKGKAAWQQAWRMSRNVEVQAAISERIKQAAMDADEVLARLAAQARGELPSSTQETPKGESGCLIPLPC
jgi:phage terminase small subunit